MNELREIQVKSWEELVRDSIRTDGRGDLYFSDGSCFVESMKELCGKKMLVAVSDRGRVLYKHWVLSSQMYRVLDYEPEGSITTAVFARIKDWESLRESAEYYCDVSDLLEFKTANFSHTMREYMGQVLPVEIATVDYINGMNKGDFIYRGEIFTKEMYDIIPIDYVTVIRIKTWKQLRSISQKNIYGDLVTPDGKVTQSMRLYCGEVFNVVLNEDGSVDLGDFTFTPDTFDVFEEIRYLKPDTLRRLTAQE